MKTQVIGIIFLILLPFIAFTKNVNIDSLIQVSNTLSDNNEKLEILNQIANQLRYKDKEQAYVYAKQSELLAIALKNQKQLAESYIIQGIIWYKRKEVDSAFFYLHKGYDISKKIDFTDGIVKSLNSIGLYTYYKRDYPLANSYLKEALVEIDKVTDRELIVMLYNNLGMLNRTLGEHDIAIDYNHRALDLCFELDNMRGAGIVSSNLGLLYEKQHKLDKAIEYLNISLEIRRSRNNKWGEAIVLNNIGIVYEVMDSLDKAISNYRQAIVLRKEVEKLYGIGMLYSNIGIIHKKMRDYDSALYYYNKSIEICKEQKNITCEAKAITNIAILKFETGFYSEAIYYFNLSREIFEQQNNVEELIKIYKGIAKSYKAVKQYENAYNYRLMYESYKDSIYNLKSQKNIAEIEGKYQNIKKEKENQALQQENALKEKRIERQIIIGITVISLGVLILIILVIVYRNKKRIDKVNRILESKNQEIKKQSVDLEEANEELKSLLSFKEDMTNMLVHDLKNPLNVILNSKYLASRKEADDNISRSGIQMLNLVTNLLDVYKYSDTSMEVYKTAFNIKESLESSIDQIEILFRDKSVELNLQCEENVLINADKDLFSRIIINLLENAVKFISKEGRIDIYCTVYQGKGVRISVKNDGPGIPIEKQKHIFEKYKRDKIAKSGNMPSTGLGLTFCKMAVEAHGGEIGVLSETETGVEFWFTLPESIVEHTDQSEITNQLESILFSLSKSDIEYLNTFKSQLHNRNLYEISLIKQILKKIENKNKFIENWKNEIEKSVYESNEDSFLFLLGFK